MRGKLGRFARALMVEHCYVPMAPVKYVQATLREVAESGDPVGELKRLAAEAWRSSEQLLEEFLTSGPRRPKDVPRPVLDRLLATGFLRFEGLAWDAPAVGLTAQSWTLLLALLLAQDRDRGGVDEALPKIIDACFEVRRGIARLFIMEGVRHPLEVEAQATHEARGLFEERLVERPSALRAVVEVFDAARGAVLGDVVSMRASLHYNGVMPLNLVEAITLLKF
jgi:hypothetical protein